MTAPQSSPSDGDMSVPPPPPPPSVLFGAPPQVARALSSFEIGEDGEEGAEGGLAAPTAEATAAAAAAILPQGASPLLSGLAAGVGAVAALQLGGDAGNLRHRIGAASHKHQLQQQQQHQQ